MPTKKIIALLLLSTILLCNNVYAREQVTASIDKDSYESFQKIIITLANNSSLPILSALGGDDLIFEQKDTQGAWQVVEHQFNCLPSDCYDDKEYLPQEIKPQQASNLDWEPRIYRNGYYLLPPEGIYRLKILYRLARTDNPIQVLTQNFFIKNSLKGAITLTQVSAYPEGPARINTLSATNPERDPLGLIKALTFKADITLTQSGNYLICGSLFNEGKQEIQTIKVEKALESGTYNFTGKLDLTNVPWWQYLPPSAFILTIGDANGKILEKQWQAGQKYRKAQYIGSTVQFIQDCLNDELTADGNLKISGRINIYQAGDYFIRATLFDPQDDPNKTSGNESSYIQPHLVAGENKFEIIFPEKLLAMNKSTGPFKLQLICNLQSDESKGDRWNTNYITKSDIASLTKE